MTDSEIKELQWITGELRHLYEIMVLGTIKQPVKLANGLLSPQIRRLEKLTTPRS